MVLVKWDSGRDEGFDFMEAVGIVFAVAVDHGYYVNDYPEGDLVWRGDGLVSMRRTIEGDLLTYSEYVT